MWTSNNALVPDPDKEDVIASKPSDWPMLHLGMRMNGWSDSNIKYYLVRSIHFRWAVRNVLTDAYSPKLSLDTL